MADTGKQSPLGVNVIGSILDNIGFWINPTAESYMGKCKLTWTENPGSSADYARTSENLIFGRTVEETSLKWVTWSINDAFFRGAASKANPLLISGTIQSTTYNNLLSIGQNAATGGRFLPALGNSPPYDNWTMQNVNTWDPTFTWKNPHPEYVNWGLAGPPAFAGYGLFSWTHPIYEGPYPVSSPYDPVTRVKYSYINEGQLASWWPFKATTSGGVVPNRGITQWGWLRLIPLQAWNEFNFNNELIVGGTNLIRYWIQEPLKNPEYRMFCDSFMSFYGFMQSTNDAIYAITNSRDFLKGTYSNMDDLVTADVAGVSLAFKEFGQDLMNLGKIIDWQYVKSFGLPSSLLKTLYNNNAINSSLNLNLLTAGIPQTRITAISTGSETATKEEEQQMYGAFLVIVGQDLREILTICNCSTQNLSTLGDCLNVKKLFPNSYKTLTVPLYNATQSAAQSAKTYYPLITPNQANLNVTLNSGGVRTAVGTLVPPGAPPVLESAIAQSELSADNVQLAVTENKVAAASGVISSKTLSVTQNVPENVQLLQQNIDVNPTVNSVAASTGEFLAQGFVRATAREIQNAPNIPAPNPQPTTNLKSDSTTVPVSTGQGIGVSSVLNQSKTTLGGGLFTDNISDLDDK